MIPRKEVIYPLDIEELRDSTKSAKLGRSRINLHESDESSIHVMLISLLSSSSIGVHMHEDRDEFYFLLEGKVELRFFDETGICSTILLLENPSENLPRTARTPKGTWHSLEVLSPEALLLEITNGPFQPTMTHWRHFKS